MTHLILHGGPERRKDERHPWRPLAAWKMIVSYTCRRARLRQATALPGPLAWSPRMSGKSKRLFNPLAETQYDVDTREAPRLNCPVRPALRIMVRPSFVPVTV